MDIKAQAKAFSPVSGWKPLVGLLVIVILGIALAKKFGVQQKAEKIVGS